MNDIKDVRFFEGGKAIFTVSNDRGQHYTFMIRRAKNWLGLKVGEKPLFASLLTGPDNTSNYTYIGIYAPDKKVVRLTAKSKYRDDSVPVKVLRWAIDKVRFGDGLPPGYAIQHENRCCRCGRRLTTPESIENGIGPECAKL